MSRSKKRQKERGTYPYKKDTGIARLPDGSPILEELLDNLKKIPVGGRKPLPTTVGIKPDYHALNATTAELERDRWSGIRRNMLANRMELWIEGQILGSIHNDVYDKEPGRLATLMEEKLGLKGHIISTDVPLHKPMN